MKSVIAICTRNRPEEVAECLNQVRAVADPRLDVWVVDASSTDDTREEVERRGVDDPNLTYMRSPVIGLARQRNYAMDAARSNQYGIIHFLDDDTRVEQNYFTAIHSRFSADASVAGVGGVILNQGKVTWVWLRWIFALYGWTPGRVLRSGRLVLGHAPRADMADLPVEWLPGCCMSYRLSAVEDLRFDDRLEGYSWGEDFDFSNRLHATGGKLISCGEAKCVHEWTETNRIAARRLARERTVLLHRWVSERRNDGYSRLAFWWSVIGEMTISLVASRRSVEAAATLRGLGEGVLEIMADMPKGRQGHRAVKE